MAFQTKKGLKYFCFDSFKKLELPHGIFTRHGGVSPLPWKSLNLGGNHGDNRINVIENRKRMFSAIGRTVESLYDVWQIHSADISCVEHPRPLDAEQQKADALLTNNPEVTLFMRFADCVPIFVYDPDKQVIGMIHAGWKGTVQKITEKTINVMIEKYGCQPEAIIAGIGPSICVDHYPVGQDVIDSVKTHLGPHSGAFIQKNNGIYYLDLWKANAAQLQAEGVKNIEISDVCTACSVSDWYSHRAEKGNTGRFGALLALKGIV